MQPWHSPLSPTQIGLAYQNSVHGETDSTKLIQGSLPSKLQVSLYKTPKTNL